MTTEFYQNCLALLIQCEQAQDPNIKHEWVFINKADAVRLANYLRNAGYVAEYKTRKTLPFSVDHYVGVPYHTLKHSYGKE